MRRRSGAGEKQRERVGCLVAKPFITSATAVVKQVIPANLPTLSSLPQTTTSEILRYWCTTKHAAPSRQAHTMPDLSPAERDLKLQFCQEVLDELAGPKHYSYSQDFLGKDHPHSSIKAYSFKANLSTIQEELSDNKYRGFQDFENAIHFMFREYLPPHLREKRMFKRCLDPYPDEKICYEPMTAIFNQTWAKRHESLAARLASTTLQSVAERSATEGNEANTLSPENATPSKRSATTAGLDNEDNNSIENAPPEPTQMASKKLRLVVEAAPAKYAASDRAFVKHLHISLSGYLFKIKSSTYDRTAKKWRYSVFNQELMGGDQTWSIPEEDIIKPDYQKGEMYRVPTATGKMVSGAVKAVRLLKARWNTRLRWWRSHRHTLRRRWRSSSRLLPENQVTMSAVKAHPGYAQARWRGTTNTG